MKYMTSEILARFRSEADDVHETAFEEWRQNGKAYRAYLRGIRPHLPPGVRKLLRLPTLKDAAIRTIAFSEKSHASFFLDLGPQAAAADRHVELRYPLTGGPGGGFRFLAHPELRGDGKPLAWWAYDEIEMHPGDPTTFTHSVLLTGGFEFQFTFPDMKVRRVSLVVPTQAEDKTEEVRREVELLTQLAAAS
jgi:hypothetical protein